MSDLVKGLEENITALKKVDPSTKVADVFRTLDERLQKFFEHSTTRPVADLVKEMEAHLAVLKTVDPTTKIIDVMATLDKNAKKPESKE